MTSTSTVDAWTATCHSRLQAIRAGILDVIDVGVPVDVYPTHRAPTRREQDATDRRDGMFRSTPVGGSRGSGVSRPTERPLISWEEASQEACSPLFELCCEAQHSLVDGFDLQPLGKGGQLLEMPVPAATRMAEATYLREARLIVDLSPDGCRAWTEQAIDWSVAVTNALAKAWIGAPDDAEVRVRGHAEWWLREGLKPMARRFGVFRRCACGCDREAPENRATRADCQKRLERERMQESA